MPYDAPYVHVFGLHPPERQKQIREFLDNMGLARGNDYEMLVVYPNKLTDDTKIWRLNERPLGFSISLRKGAFQDMALKMLDELADFNKGRELAGWRGSEIAYAKAFNDDASVPATLITNIINNADFQAHNLTMRIFRLTTSHGWQAMRCDVRCMSYRSC